MQSLMEHLNRTDQNNLLWKRKALIAFMNAPAFLIWLRLSLIELNWIYFIWAIATGNKAPIVTAKSVIRELWVGAQSSQISLAFRKLNILSITLFSIFNVSYFQTKSTCIQIYVRIQNTMWPFVELNSIRKILAGLPRRP